MLSHKSYKVDDNKNVVVLDIDEEHIEEYVEKSIVSICEGDSDTDISTVKLKVKDYLRSKTYNQRKGAIAEFYIHLFFKELGYKQEFLFLNLEENSMKKGFDGYYTLNKEQWILESKSGENIPHVSKINEAYADLVVKLSSKAKNNPWHNAYNHAANYAVCAEKDLIKRLKKLENDYVNGIHQPMNTYNLIPCGTVYGYNSIDEYQKDEICTEVISNIDNMQGKKVCIVAVSNRALKAFLKYVGIDEGE